MVGSSVPSGRGVKSSRVLNLVAARFVPQVVVSYSCSVVYDGGNSYLMRTVFFFFFHVSFFVPLRNSRTATERRPCTARGPRRRASASGSCSLSMTR